MKTAAESVREKNPTADLDQFAQLVLEEVMRNREAYLEAWVAETGLLPSECEIVEERRGSSVVTYIRKRESSRL